MVLTEQSQQEQTGREPRSEQQWSVEPDGGGSPLQVQVVEIRNRLGRPSVFETDEELEEFLAWLEAERHRDRDLYRQMPTDWDDPEVWLPEEWP